VVSDDLPDGTGVYLLKDSAGKILYVGKARSIRDRVQSHRQSERDRMLMGQVTAVDYILTDTEHEALLLESNLIKRNRPRYNVRLKDDKRYPYIELTNERFPILRVTRRPEDQNQRYYGPFTDVGAARRTLKLVRRAFPLRSCKHLPKRPCLDYQTHLCSAPCVGKIGNEQYDRLVQGADLFLSGERHSMAHLLIDEMRRQMVEAAGDLEYERAAKIRDEIKSLERTLEKQEIMTPEGEDADIIAISSRNDLACIEIFFLREGKLVGADHFYMEGSSDEPLAPFIKQYYSSTTPPKKVQIQKDLPEDVDNWLSDLGATISVNSRGRLMGMAYKNASSLLRQEELNSKKGIDELGKYLSIPSPSRIEGIDISNFGGGEAVGSVVVFNDGMPSKGEYRRFKMEMEGPDDVGMIADVVRRRYSKTEAPDLILLDGGRGQLNGARFALEELGVNAPIIALAKKEDDIFLPDMPLQHMRPDSPALLLLKHVRDEAHRFAINYHRKLRSQRGKKSWLDETPGIGQKRKRALLLRFGSLDNVKKASVDELQDVLHNRAVVKELIEHIRSS